MGHEEAEFASHVNGEAILCDAELEVITAGKLAAEIFNRDMEGPNGWVARLPSKARP